VVTDARAILFEDIRAARPPIFDADQYESWREAIGQSILAYPETADRWACVTCLAHDLINAYPHIAMHHALHMMAECVFEAKIRYGDTYEREG
jgi:hypothetical protein